MVGRDVGLAKAHIVVDEHPDSAGAALSGRGRQRWRGGQRGWVAIGEVTRHAAQGFLFVLPLVLALEAVFADVDELDARRLTRKDVARGALWRADHRIVDCLRDEGNSRHRGKGIIAARETAFRAAGVAGRLLNDRLVLKAVAENRTCFAMAAASP